MSPDKKILLVSLLELLKDMPQVRAHHFNDLVNKDMPALAHMKTLVCDHKEYVAHNFEYLVKQNEEALFKAICGLSSEVSIQNINVHPLYKIVSIAHPIFANRRDMSPSVLAYRLSKEGIKALIFLDTDTCFRLYTSEFILVAMKKEKK